MAILLVKIPEQATLPMNEFFDYDGVCWALSRSRYAGGRECIRLEDFYDSDVRAEEIGPVTVLFVCKEEKTREDGWIMLEEDSEEDVRWLAAGWYREAKVFRQLQRKKCCSASAGSAFSGRVPVPAQQRLFQQA